MLLISLMMRDILSLYSSSRSKKIKEIKGVLTILSLLIIVISDAVQASDTVVHQFESLIHIVLDNLVSEVEFGHRLGNSDDGKERSWGDVHITDKFRALSLELSFLNIFSNNIVVKISGNSWVEGLSVGNE